MIKQEGFSYSFDEDKCSLCDGNCCTGESGNIWINRDEITILSNYFNIDTQGLKDKYLIKKGYKYSIKEVNIDAVNYACIFFDLDKKLCTIYDVRPMQCQTFPFWDYFKNRVDEVREECPAIS